MDLQQTGLVELGFPCDYWLTIELARQWRSPVFPKVASREAVQQWQLYLRECLGMATVAQSGRADSSWHATAEALSEGMAHDLQLLRQHDPQLVASVDASCGSPALPSALTCPHCRAESRHLSEGVYYCSHCRTVNDTQPWDKGKAILPVATSNPNAVPVAVVRLHAPFRLTSTPAQPLQPPPMPAAEPLGTLLDVAQRIIEHEVERFPCAIPRTHEQHDQLRQQRKAMDLELNKWTREAMKTDLRGKIEFREFKMQLSAFAEACQRLLAAESTWYSQNSDQIPEFIRKDPDYVDERVNAQAQYTRGILEKVYAARNQLVDLWTALGGSRPPVKPGGPDSSDSPAAQADQPAQAPQGGVQQASNCTLEEASSAQPATKFVEGQSKAPVELFYSYSHNDEKQRARLEKHLSMLQRQGVIAGWHDRKIGAGTEWKGQIDKHLNSARVILLLVSADFLHSNYCYDVEMQRAIERHKAGEARVIPIILKPCDWQHPPLNDLQALPKDAKPVTKWKDRDEAFTDVARGIRAAVAELADGL